MAGAATSPITDATEDMAGPPVSGSPVEISVVTDLDGFDALREDWDDLFERAAEPQQVFQRHIFLRYWVRHYLEPATRLCVVTGRIDGRLVALWPLVRRRSLGIDTLSFMGAPVAQFGDVLVEAGDSRSAVLAAGWNAVASLGADIFEARRVRADAALCALAMPSGALPDGMQAPFASLPRRVLADGPGMAYAARERSNFRRRLKKLRERGDITFSEPDPGSTAAAAAAAAAISIKKNWLLASDILSPAVMDSRFQAFFEDLASDAATDLHISAIACDGQPIAIDLAIDCKGHTFGHVLAAASGYEVEGLGRLLIHRTFAAASHRGNRVFDLLAPADPYKLQHADGQVAVRDYAFAFSRRGRLVRAVVLARLQPMAKAWAKRLPSGLVRKLVGRKIKVAQASQAS